MKNMLYRYTYVKLANKAHCIIQDQLKVERRSSRSAPCHMIVPSFVRVAVTFSPLYDTATLLRPGFSMPAASRSARLTPPPLPPSFLGRLAAAGTCARRVQSRGRLITSTIVR